MLQSVLINKPKFLKAKIIRERARDFSLNGRRAEHQILISGLVGGNPTMNTPRLRRGGG